MPDWNSPTELALEAGAFSKLMHSLLGIYLYEWLISLDFEWDFICGKKKLRWPMIFYFLNRYLFLVVMILLAVSLDSTTEINCQAIYTFSQIAGNASIGLASINLSIRTMAVWGWNRYLVGGLVVVILGHWSVIFQGVQLKAAWIPGAGCAPSQTSNTIFVAIFIYSMCFDLLILSLTTYKLVNRISGKNIMGKSKLAEVIFRDGLIYFVIAGVLVLFSAAFSCLTFMFSFVANLLATIFMLLNLNSIMSIIFNVPAGVGCTIAATRAVRRLTNFSQKSSEAYSSGSNSGPIHIKTPVTRFAGRVGSAHQAGVHVQMETFTRGGETTTPGYFDSVTQKHSDNSDVDIEVDVEKGRGF